MITSKSQQAPFYLELGQLTSECVNHLTPSFDHLPSSPYADGKFRLRRYSCFCMDKGVLTRLPSQAFVQDEQINHFQGNVVRRYEDITEHTLLDPAFIELFEHFQKMAEVADNTPIEVHQLRIFADHQSVEVAPEGVHQDGFDRIGIYVMQRHNIQGGHINVHSDKHSPALISHDFDKGEFVVLNDRKFFHSAQPIQPIDGEQGYMDIFVLTANLLH
ncbi:2OG-Fe dioxygenase family protein [Marinomonas sp. M1K-6]|uniref:2OG-Fe dioxygenase family protein n=1 Tax=Marinomonas profundi TaxID=2726122 RepID=A0A847QX34_9GAMM|nr:2OG-Fe dioxygenase family protein [Marinomonas profundi]NLQ16889.1 2OG-Fe dioxygenase family protein [Marinomonas profundi]UDV02621.1 2OG-Fe dioxygenase family protein [Marinomonas profundi]